MDGTRGLLDRLALREEKIAGIPGLHSDEIGFCAEVLDFRGEDDFCGWHGERQLVYGWKKGGVDSPALGRCQRAFCFLSRSSESARRMPAGAGWEPQMNADIYAACADASSGGRSSSWLLELGV
jgi:hypothetical protein